MLRPQGLEFDAVVIGGFDAERLPHRRTVATDDLVSAGGRRATPPLCAGMTRTRFERHLSAAVTAHGQP